MVIDVWFGVRVHVVVGRFVHAIGAQVVRWDRAAVWRATVGAWGRWRRT